MKKNEKQEPKKSYTAYLDNGEKYQFVMDESSDIAAAAKYAKLWNRLAGVTASVVKIRENA